MGGRRSQDRYFYIGLAVITALSFGLRFWGLGRFDDLIFDEVYYAKFAQGYLRGAAIFDAHPPLGKYAIALGIWLHSHLSQFLSPYWKVPFGPFANELMLNPISYRWMNAFVGAWIPMLVVWIANLLTGGLLTREFWVRRRVCFALLAGGFVAIDGLFVTESRYALTNIYIVFFGLLGHGLWFCANGLAYGEQKKQRLCFRLLSGIALGAAVATKWNGLGYVLSLGLWELWRAVNGRKMRFSLQQVFTSRFAKSVLFYGLFLALVPIVTYCCLWWPHLRLDDFSFIGVHQTLLTFHQDLDSFQVTCSQWFTWPLLIKPMAYGYVDAGEQVFTVNNLGNPALWWLSGAAVLLVLADRVMALRRCFANRKFFNGDGVQTYLLIGYLANWLPWMVVDRCTYIYLFMPAAVYGFMLLAWLLSGWLTADAAVESRWVGFVMLGAIAFSFLFWLPLSLGLSLTPEQLQLRWWLRSWI